MDILTQAKSLSTLKADRRWLHTNAETGFNLTKTLEYVKNRLTELGYTPIKCGKAGLYATVGSGSKTILLRADMDALPIREDSGLSIASQNGNMHACGHDMHTAMLLGAAKLLMDHKKELGGTVKLMFQPAEEIFEGAKDMIQNGILQDPKPDAALMIHVTAALPLPAGTVIVSAPGVSAPAADYFTIDVTGKGCHGSAPQNGVDALTAAAHILIALQELTARELPASAEAVLTVGKMESGSAANAIANSAKMSGTIRTYDEETRVFVKKRLADISRGIAAAFRAEAEVEFGSGCPTLINDAALSGKVYDTLLPLLGKDRVLSAAVMGSTKGGGSEDFAYVSQEVPSLMLALAAGEPDKGFPYPQHHPKVIFDESVLPIGAVVLAHCALEFLK